MFLDSFYKIGSMPGKFSIPLNPIILPVQHRRSRFPIEAKTIQTQLREMTVQDDKMTPQVEPTPWVSSLAYPKKANGTLSVCLDPRDPNRAIIHKQHKASTLAEITHGLVSLLTYSKLGAKMTF